MGVGSCKGSTRGQGGLGMRRENWELDQKGLRMSPGMFED